MKEKHYFETLQNCVVNKRNYELNYYDEYVTPTTIYQLSDFDPVDTALRIKKLIQHYNATYACRLFECFPTTIAAQPLGYDNKIQYTKLV